MKWAKHFYNLIKHWFSFSHFTDIFTGDDDDVESICHTENEVLCDLFYCPAGLSWVSFLLSPSSPAPLPCADCCQLGQFSVLFCGFSSWSAANWEHYLYIYIIYVYVACTLCYLLCRQDVAGVAGRGQTWNLFCQTANCRIYISKWTRNGLVALPAKVANIKGSSWRICKQAGELPLAYLPLATPLVLPLPSPSSLGGVTDCVTNQFNGFQGV